MARQSECLMFISYSEIMRMRLSAFHIEPYIDCVPLKLNVATGLI